MARQAGEGPGCRAALVATLGLALTVSACDLMPAGPSHGSPSPDGGPVGPGTPAQSDLGLTVTGVVSGDGRPLQNAIVEVRSFGFMDIATTDASGRYRVAVRPDSPMWVTAHDGQFNLQPCAVWFAHTALDPVVRDADVRLSSAEGLSSVPLVPPAGRRNVSGTIYALTAEGKQPVADARVAWDLANDDWKAWTATDSAGRFTLCGLAAGAVQVAAYQGSRWGWASVEPGGDADIELTIEKLE